ncbi:MAG: tetratricopeptide repeat protein [Chloroflexi bacterium]|nr:tetratricopeptide repeat protein [Chloroflexota bacterium]
MSSRPAHQFQIMETIVRMLRRRRTYPILVGIIIVLFTVACSGTTAIPTIDSSAADLDVATAEPTSTTESAPQDEITSSPQISPTATRTPTPEPDETPISETESVSFYIRAFNSIGRGEYVDAERTFTTVIQLEPGFARGWDGRGQALMLQGKYEEAMLDFDRAIELKPNLADAYANRSLTRMALNDTAGAGRDAKRAIELDEESVGAQIVLGRIYAQQADTDRALEWFNLAVATEPEDGSTWWWRGRFYRDVLAQGNLALDDFNRAIELEPAQAALYIDRALLYIQAQVFSDLARKDIEEAISLAQDPKLPSIIERAEDLLAILDERETAVQ